MIEDLEAPADVPGSSPPLPVPPPAAAEPQEAAPRARRQRTPRGEGPRQVEAARPAARDLTAPVKQNIAREALKVDVPAELALLQRLHRRRLDTGMDIRDQVAIAVDEYLVAEGY